MSNKIWVRNFSLVIVIFLILIPSINIIIDNEKIFKNLSGDCEIVGNERFGKIEYLNKNFSQYNSYLIGGSRIGVVRPEIVNKYIPGSRFYNLFTHISTIWESKSLINYISTHYVIKNIIFQLSLNDISDLNSPTQNNYRISGENPIIFYFKYIFNYNLFNIINQNILIKQSAFDLLPLNCDGTWRFQYLEDTIAVIGDNFFKDEKKFPNNIHWNVKLKSIDKKMKDILDIKKTCREHNINIIFCFIPDNHLQMGLYNTDSYYTLIKRLSMTTDFWDFSGFNSITTNNKNYYEKAHYRYFVGDMMISKIFNDSIVAIPKDFGFYVTKGNADFHIQHLKEEYLAWKSGKKPN